MTDILATVLMVANVALMARIHLQARKGTDKSDSQ